MNRWSPVTLKRGVTRHADGETFHGDIWVRNAEKLRRLGLARRRDPSMFELAERRSRERRNKGQA